MGTERDALAGTYPPRPSVSQHAGRVELRGRNDDALSVRAAERMGAVLRSLVRSGLRAIQKQSAASGSSMRSASPIAWATSETPRAVRMSNQASQMSSVPVIVAAVAATGERRRAAIAVV